MVSFPWDGTVPHSDDEDSDDAPQEEAAFERKTSMGGCSDGAARSDAGSNKTLSWRADALDMGDRLASSSAAKKGGASVDSIVDLVTAERERWEEEKQALETRLEELKQEQQAMMKDRKDPEKESLKAQLQDLRKMIKSRSRFGAWVCERHMQESDDEDDGNADKEALRAQLQTLRDELRSARLEARAKARAQSGSAGAARA